LELSAYRFESAAFFGVEWHSPARNCNPKWP
jgi:hypothetical protein